MNKQKLIVIVGQTASGKTSLGIEIANKFNGEIISADSRAIYREMNIGTAKPLMDIEGDLYIVEGIRHYGFDLVNPDEHFHALDFKKYAQDKIQEIASEGKLPIIVGGTGLYISGVIDNFDFEGGSVSESLYDVLEIGIAVDRAVIYDRIDRRVYKMIELGLVEEVKRLKDRYGCDVKSMTGIGYRQICEYLNSEVTLDTAIANIKLDTRHYAKRQMTWFNRDKRIHWIENTKDAVALVDNFIK